MRRTSTIVVSGVAFAVLMVLGVVWPAPVDLLNRSVLRLPLAIDDRSFLGREAPAWDVIYWSLAGLFAIALLQGRTGALRDSWRNAREDLGTFPFGIAEHLREISGARAVAFAAATVAAIASVWALLDFPLIAASEAIQSNLTRAIVGLFNRAGGGMNPVMVIAFFAVAGMVFAIRRWWLYAIAMSAAGGIGGLLVQATKYIVGRSRPEIWYGPFHYVDAPSSSFPSGHTVGVFAIAGVLMFGARSVTARVVAFLLAAAVAFSRVLAFRHWPSDVLASAILGSVLAWFFVRAALKGAENDG